MPSSHVPAQTDPAALHEAAAALRDAQRTGTPCAPVRGRFGDLDVRAAVETGYAIQRINGHRARAEGRRLIGRKIGLTSPAVQRQLGVDRPDFGALFADMSVPEDAVLPTARLLQPKVEAELALVLREDLDLPDCTEADVVRAVDHALPALEIVDSRIAGWDISILDTIADNASSGMFVLGAARVPLSALDPAAVEMTMTRNGETVSTGRGSDCLGSPLTAARWLASAMARAGDPLRSGDVVLTGALGPMVSAEPGDVFAARISGLGTVRTRFDGGCGSREA
ncbi:fumarylacetoacetate hydrolase family protein [Streptomyces sp. NPDC093252]|uniref:2-keto-4-pentenoate hydratase n=1 Tax=Streptomyces sp. NPDC093252 TaxID=3154980 RepID=UPI003430BCDF